MSEVLFDPGYSKFVSSFMYFNSEVEQILRAAKRPQEKAFKYSQYYPQIFSTMLNEIGFYYGCLLWAAYIKYKYKDNPQIIANNSFYGKTEKDLEGYDYLLEVNYLLKYFEKYPKDLTYYRYAGKPIEEKYKKTVEIYKEFLVLNKSFVNTEKTSDLVLPKEIKQLGKDDFDKVKTLIDKTVADGDFNRLYDFTIF